MVRNVVLRRPRKQKRGRAWGQPTSNLESTDCGCFTPRLSDIVTGIMYVSSIRPNCCEVVICGYQLNRSKRMPDN